MSGKPNRIREHYDENGYVIVRDVVDAELLDEMRQHLDWLLARHPEMQNLQIIPPILAASDPFWMRVVSDERLLDIAEQFVGRSISLFQSTYFLKPAFDGRPVPWHQDGWYWPLDPQDGVVSIWLAVDESSPENGCLRVIPGSHRGEVKDHIQDADAAGGFQNRLSSEFVDEAKAVDLILKPGDVSIHSPKIIHGSNANTSPKRRCGLTTSYIPTSTRIVRGAAGWPDEIWWSNGRWCASLHLRGGDAAHANEYQVWPQYDAARHMAFRGCGQTHD